MSTPRSSSLARLFLRYCRGPQHPAKYRLIALIGRWLIPADGFVADVSAGFRMRLQVFDHLERCLVVRGDYEPLASAFVRANFPPGGVGVVAGANLGYYPLLMARAGGGGSRVLGVEPFPGTLQRGARNVALNPDLAGSILLVAGALGREPGHVRITPPPPEHTGLAQVQAGPGDGIWVRVDRLDELTRRLLPRRADLMVLDVEGWEPEVLAGFGEAAPEMMLVENDPRHHAERGGTEAAFFTTLAGLGYNLAHLDGREARPGDFFPEQTVVAWKPGSAPKWNPPAR